jgi:glutamate--cysteine ligase
MSLKTELAVPCLTTAQTGPLFPLEVDILKNFTKIEDWFRKYFAKYPAPINSSVDLRNSHYKIAPIDTNLFPAGFNNLNPDFLPMCVQAVQAVLQKNCTRILIIPENHTRNKFYVQSLSVIRDIFLNAGFEVRFGNLDTNATDNLVLEVENGDYMMLEPLVRVKNKLGVGDFFPCLILLNNDLSAGVPEILQNTENLVEPPIFLGWSSRLKSHHFKIYNEVANDFAKLIGIDPWLINPLFSTNTEVDFMQQLGFENLATQVDDLLQKITKKYKEYSIKDKPFVVIKADNGTYGMSVMKVHSGREILDLNRKKRTKMSSTKGNQKVNKVLLQEGVYSYETMNSAVSEPVIYMLGQYVIGGFYRVHKDLGIDDILNTPGMHFEPLAFAKACNMPSSKLNVDNSLNRFYVYGVIARLATLAAAIEKIR